MVSVGAEESIPGDEVGVSDAVEYGGGVGRGEEGGAEGEEAGGENRVLLEVLADDVGVDLMEAEERAAGTEEAGNGEGGGRRGGGGFRDGGGGGRGGARRGTQGRRDQTRFILVGFTTE